MVESETKPFLEHLEDLRFTLLKVGAVLLLGMIVAACFAPELLAFLKKPLAMAGKDPESFLIQLKVTGGLNVFVRVIFWGGLLLASPLITYFLSSFIFPGLMEQERKAILGSSGIALLLFIVGVSLGFFCIRYALAFMFKITSWMQIGQENVLITDYVSFVLKMLLGFGLAFELPVVVYVLGVLGIVDSADLKSKRKHVFVGILVMAMLLTPQDPFTMLIMAVPLYGLFEVCIQLIAIKERKDALELN